ncbi:MAG: polysaccharide deacetylase family protein [Bacilli bacterium]
MIRKVFDVIGILVLICFSFYYTEKAVFLIRKKDPIMIKIEEVKTNYSVEATNALKINNDSIIPGYNGVEVDINKSYSRMKKIDKFNETMLVFNETVPSISSMNSKKYIVGGNPRKNMISLVFKVKETRELNRILVLLKNKDIAASFFVDNKWIEDNINLIYKINNNGHTIHNYGCDNDSIKWTNNLVRELIYKEPKYCYTEEKNQNILNICSKNNMGTIIPNIIVENYHLFDVNKVIKSGSIISFDTSKTSLEYLITIINFIKYKGYNIGTIDTHLSEER